MWWFWMVACSSTQRDTSARAQTCSERYAGEPPASGEAIQALVAAAVTRDAPALRGLTIQYAEISGASVFFQAGLDVTTLEAPPLERTYTIQYNPALFLDPPSRPAVGAILIHELRHILDYTEMSAEELSAFIAWYLTADDISTYERQTDEYVLERGCGLGLIAYREWLYATIPEEDLEEKKKSYYTPEEIVAWMAAN